MNNLSIEWYYHMVPSSCDLNGHATENQLVYIPFLVFDISILKFWSYITSNFIIYTCYRECRQSGNIVYSYRKQWKFLMREIHVIIVHISCYYLLRIAGNNDKIIWKRYLIIIVIGFWGGMLSLYSLGAVQIKFIKITLCCRVSSVVVKLFCHRKED